MIDIIQSRLKTYTLTSRRDEENALKEICQEIALSGLARSGFFKMAAFQGGTCLRIMHGLQRFSEDLDFILHTEEHNFTGQNYFKTIDSEFQAYGLNVQILDRSKAPNAVKKAFLKENSFAKVLELSYPRNRSDAQHLLIKLEVDTHPPLGSQYEMRYLEFPTSYSIVVQNQASLFAGKLHALLSRQYEKGRDWYDFLWYIQRKTPINYSFLQNALEQCGPYQGQRLPKKLLMFKEWLVVALKDKIRATNWENVKLDVRAFISKKEQAALDSWNEALFSQMTEKL